MRTWLSCIALILACSAAAAQTAMQPAVQTAAPLGGYWLTAERDGDVVRLSGQVPGGATRTVLGTYAAALFGAASVENQLTAHDGPVAPEWVNMAMASLDALNQIAEGRAELTDGAVMVEGTVSEPEEAGYLTRAIRDTLPPGVRISTAFDVPSPGPDVWRDVSPERCAFLMNRVARDRKITFDPGSVEIAEESLPALSAIATIFARCPEAEIEIGGHTDSKGGAEANMALSQARAEAVLEVLQGAGVRLRQLRARGFGEEQPVADNETEEGRETNRRIDFTAVE